MLALVAQIGLLAYVATLGLGFAIAAGTLLTLTAYLTGAEVERQAQSLSQARDDLDDFIAEATSALASDHVEAEERERLQDMLRGVNAIRSRLP